MGSTSGPCDGLSEVGGQLLGPSELLLFENEHSIPSIIPLVNDHFSLPPPTLVLLDCCDPCSLAFLLPFSP